MRRLGSAVAALGLAVLWAGSAQAQRGGGAEGRGILMNPTVQHELKLSAEQVEKCQKLLESLFEKHRDEWQKARALQGSERFEKSREVMRTFQAERNKALADILTPEQSKRFRQIEWQWRAPETFNDPEVQGRLKLTDEQKEKIRTIEQDARREMREAFQNAQGDREEALKKFSELRKQTLDKAMTVLTSEQKNAWNELTGKPLAPEFGARRQGSGEGKR